MLRKLNTNMVRLLTISCLSFLISSLPVEAQSPLSKLVGTARDISGGVMPGVQVVALDEARGYNRTAVTDDQGNYEIELLLEGTYTITCELPGFKKFVRTHIPLLSRQVLRIDVALEIGEVTESVTVTGAAPVVASETAEVSSGSGTRQMYELTMGDRVGSMVWDVAVGQYSAVAFNFRAAGNTTMQAGVRVDGLDLQLQQTAIHSDFMQEVKMTYSGNKAEAAVPLLMSGTTRGGTNRFHGKVDAILSNPALNALGPNPNARRSSGQVTERFYYYQAAGPVILPKIYDGGDRTFFWFGFQKRVVPLPVRNRGAQFIPPLAWRAGDFSKAPANIFTNPAKVLINPYTGQPFSGGKIPESLISNVAKNLQTLYLTPNFGGGIADPQHFVGLNYQNVGAAGGIFQKFDGYVLDVRIDHELTQKDTLGYSLMHTSNTVAWDASDMGMFAIGQTDEPYMDTGYWTHAFSPAVLNEFRIGYSTFGGGWGMLRGDPGLGFTPAFNKGGFDMLRRIGITWQPTGLPEDHFEAGALPYMCITGILGPVCQGVFDSHKSARRLINIIDNFSIARKSHSLKAGVDLLWRRDPERSGEFAPFGRFQFDGRFTGLPYGDFLLGLPGTSSRQGLLPEPIKVGSRPAFYFQDDWKLRPNLTLELGLRFEYFPPVHEKNLRIVNFDPGTGSLVVPDKALQQVDPLFPTKLIPVITASQAGYPELLLKYPQPLFYPRFGFAWRPFNNAKTVVRAGVGQFGQPTSTRSGSIASNSPFALSESFDNVFTSGQPAFAMPFPFPSRAGRIPGQIAFGVIAQLPITYSHNWNLTVEREILPNTGVRISYLGAKVTQMPYQRDINKPLPGLLPYRSDCASRPAGTCVGPQYKNFGRVTLVDAGGNQNYHGLELELHRRWAEGLEFMVDYAWSRTISDADDVGSPNSTGAFGTSIENPYDRKRDRSLSGATRPHRVVINHVWRLPFGRGSRWLNQDTLLEHILGGWTLMGRWAYSSRPPLTPLWSGSDFSNTNSFRARPDVVPGCNPNIDKPSASKTYNSDCFVRPPNGRFGTAGKSIIKGMPAGFWQSSLLGIFKTFTLGSVLSEEGLRFRIGAEMTNAINHPVLVLNSVVVNTPRADAGFYTGGRAIRFNLRLEF